MQRVPLRVKLNRPVEPGAVRDELHMPDRCEAVLEADDGAFVDAEQAAGLIAKIAVPQVAVEPMRQLETRFVERQPQRRRQVDDAVVGFSRLQRRVVVGGLGERGRSKRKNESSEDTKGYERFESPCYHEPGR